MARRSSASAFSLSERASASSPSRSTSAPRSRSTRRSCSARPTHPSSSSSARWSVCRDSAARCSAVITSARASSSAAPSAATRVWPTSTRSSLGRLFPAEALLLPGQRGMLGRQEGDLDRPPLGLERLVLLRLLRLALEGAELPLDLVHHVPHAEEILARRLQLAERLGPLELVPGDARRLLHEDPPVERLRGEDVGQTLLLHQRVGLRVHARAQEEIVDVLQPADRLVEEVLGLAVPVEAPSDPHLAPRHAQLAVVGEREQDLGQPERPPRGRPVEDHVLHPVAAEGLGALLAERPPERVRDVRFAAAVGADDGGDPGKDAHLGAIREGLEAEQRHSLEPHDCQRLIARPRGPSKEKIPGVGAFAVPTPTC